MEALLWDIPRARRTDPQTSHEAAGRFDPTLHRAMIFAGVVANPGLTCAELAPIVGLSYIQISRRTNELETLGLIVEAGKRICSVNGTRMRTWNPTDCTTGDGSPKEVSNVS